MLAHLKRNFGREKKHFHTEVCIICGINFKRRDRDKLWPQKCDPKFIESSQKIFIVSEEMETWQEKNSEVAICQLLANLLKIYMQMFWWKRFRLHWFWVWNLQNIWHRTGFSAHLDNKTRWDNVDIPLPTFSFQKS